MKLILQQGGGESIPQRLKKMATPSSHWHPNTGNAMDNIIYSMAFWEIEMEALDLPVYAVYYNHRVERLNIPFYKAPDGSLWTEGNHGLQLACDMNSENLVLPQPFVGTLVGYISCDALAGREAIHYSFREDYDPAEELRKAFEEELKYARQNARVPVFNCKLKHEEELEALFQEALLRGKKTGVYRAPYRSDMLVFDENE